MVKKVFSVRREKSNYKIRSGILNENAETLLQRNKNLIKRLAKI